MRITLSFILLMGCALTPPQSRLKGCLSAPRQDEVCIPEIVGGFVMGHEELSWTPPECAEGEACPPGVTNARDFSPPHRVKVKSFFLDQYEVTNQQYLSCVEAGVCPEECQVLRGCAGGKFSEYSIRDERLSDYPVATVTFAGAQAYCFFVGKRLPTEAEWERAARGPKGANEYPWGMEPMACGEGSFPCPEETPPFGWRQTWHVPVGSATKDSTEEGVFGLVTGAPELLQDLYQPNFYRYSQVASPFSVEGKTHVLRGKVFPHGELVYKGVKTPLPVWARGFGSIGGIRCARTDQANSVETEGLLEVRKKLLSGQSLSGGQP